MDATPTLTSTSASASASSAAAAASTASGKTLSRNALYAPFQALTQTKVEPHLFLLSKKKGSTPKNIQESGLVQLLASVSHNLHREYCHVTNNGSKNGGSKPLQVSDMDNRVRHRGVTLIGGGITSSLGGPSAAAATHQHAAKGQRKRRRSKCVFANKATVDEINAKWAQYDARSVHRELKLLRRLNHRWNAYALQILELKTHPALLHRMDLLGAHVHVVTCSQRRELVGQRAVVVETTANLWIVAMLRTRRAKRESSNDAGDAPQGADGQKTDGLQRVLRLERIPKRGSEIALVVPVGSPQSDANDLDDEIDTDNNALVDAKECIDMPMDSEVIQIMMRSGAEPR